tara:strand:+ start:11357 stop:14401 length:3045 start_codon:yes stop_codon:yes gene_type:complete
MSTVLIISIFTIYLINPVEARDDACCEKTLTGESCQYTALKNCDKSYNYAPTSCEQTQYCKPICCVNTQEGVCYKNVPAAQCADKGGEIDATNANCEIAQCQQGCCNLGDQYFLSTEKGCHLKAKAYPNINKEEIFDNSITKESTCIAQGQKKDDGCCVTSAVLEDVCTRTTREQCQGTFHKDTLCSDSNLLCGCKPQHEKRCIAGEEDVYWFDSCGNKEEKAEDCDYTKGTLCQTKDGKAACRSVDCSQTIAIPNNPHDPKIGTGDARKHGESWCSYESGAGDFLDRVGSRHYRHVCVNGQELIQGCRDYREEICLQTEVEGFSVGNCLNNEIYESEVTQNVSSVPKGQTFWEGSNEDLCAEGTTECTVIWAKKGNLDDWDCETNCFCQEQTHIDEMAKYCKTKGDCGADINILNKKTTDGLQVEWVGDARGERPDVLSDKNYWANRSVYGVYGGLIGLKQFVEELFTEDPEVYDTFEETTLLAGGAVLVVLGILTWFDVLVSAGTVLFEIAGAAVGVPVWGWVIAIIVIVLSWIIGGGTTREATVTVSCLPYVAPVGADDCGKCGNDPRYQTNNYENPVLCNEYRCKSLGVACELVNPGTVDAKCVGKNINDPNSPIILPWEEILPKKYTLTPTAKGYEITPEVPSYERITFGIKTDETAQCKFDVAIVDTYEEMASFFGRNIYTDAFNVSLTLHGGKDYTYYIRCQDINGNSNVAPYIIQLSTSKETDKTPPLIEQTSITNGASIAVGVNETLLEVYLNEPTDSCKWVKGLDESYETMPKENLFVCNGKSNNALYPEKYRCTGILKDITPAAENMYHIRCKDLGGNVNEEGYKFTLKGTRNLVITTKAPEGELYITSPTLEITTTLGAEEGKATCSYQAKNAKPIPFFTTGTKFHTQPLKDLTLGNYAYDIVCTDIAGNEDKTTIAFSINVDTTPPKIINLYSDKTTLYVLTNEESTCDYSTTKKSYTRAEGTLMTGEEVKEHTLFIEKPRYYITCWDEYDNTMEPITVYT